MSRRERELDADPKVRGLATALGVRDSQGLRRIISDAAVAKVEGWMVSCGLEPSTLEEVHRLILNRTRLEVIRIDDDADLAAVEQRFANELPALNVQLRLEFDKGVTEALVVRRDNTDTKGGRFLAVVDARRNQGARAWFASRHEPSHLLVPDPHGQVLYRRTGIDRPEPLEQVIDSIASAVGFWAPLVRPVVLEEVKVGATLLDALDSARARLAPEASREAAFRAFVQHLERPTLVLYVGEAPRTEDRALGRFAESYALRALTVIANDAARATGMVVWPNIRVPQESAIHLAFRQKVWSTTQSAAERLGAWGDSRGRRLKDYPVRVVARGPWAVLTLDG